MKNIIAQQTIENLKKAQDLMENKPDRVEDVARILDLELKAEYWGINPDDFDYKNDPQMLENAIEECENENKKSSNEQFTGYLHSIEIY